MSTHLGVGSFLAKVPRLTPAKVVALLAAMLGAVVALGLAASAASAETFSNTAGITINDDANPDCAVPGTATPYPSEIAVSSLDSSISDVNVSVSGLSHTSPDDVGLLLVSPTGQSTLLMTDSGGFSAVSGINLTFDDAASGFLPNGPFLSSGTYKPSVGASSVGCLAPGSFPDAPLGPYGSSLSVFNGSDPNGTWKLYVIDDSGGDSGSIDGWSLTFNSSPTAEDDSYSTNEDTSANIAVLSNDTDVDGDTLSVSNFDATSAQGGTVSKNADGTLTYTPAANFYGTDTFTYTVSDGNGGTDTATVTITVTPVNDAPTVTVDRGGSCGSASDMRGTINLALSDPDDPPESLTLTASSSNRSVLPNRNISFGGGTDASRTMTVSSLTGSGTSDVTITVSDEGDLTGTVLVRVISGSASNNTLTGSANADMIFARKGRDTVSAQGANDLMCGGNGNDRLTGGPGADHFGGGSGTDTATDFNAGEGDTMSGIP